ncbi:MAG: hypothetical protein HYZ53_01525 [Planctomycetes bacterium]|nr:hypothetical protein [Planctomycetota bacterium]
MEKSTEPQSSPEPDGSWEVKPSAADFLGRVAVLNGMTTQARVDECLRIQSQMRAAGLTRRLGDLLVDKGYLTKAQVHELLELRRNQASIQETKVPHAPLTASVGDSLADILLSNFLVSRAAVEECLSLQRKLNRLGVKIPLADVLHQRGYLGTDAAVMVQRVERARRGRSRSRLAVSIGGALGAILLAIALVWWVRSATPVDPGPTGDGVESGAGRQKPPAPVEDPGAGKPATAGTGASTPGGKPWSGVPLVGGTRKTGGGEGAAGGPAAPPAVSSGPPSEQELVRRRLEEEARIRKIERKLFPEARRDSGEDGDTEGDGGGVGGGSR